MKSHGMLHEWADFGVWQTDMVLVCQRFHAVCVNNMSLYDAGISFCQNKRAGYDDSHLVSYIYNLFYLIALDPVAVLPCQGRGSFPGRHEEWRLQGRTSCNFF